MAFASTPVNTRPRRSTLLQIAASLIATSSLLTLNSALALDEGVVATVNGEPVHESTLAAVQRQLQGREQAPAKEQIIEELVNLNLLSQLATEEGLHESDEIRSVLELQRLQVLANAYMGKLSEELDLPEEQLRAEYDKQVAAVPTEEYNASQIMSASEEDAKEIIAKLEKGEDFAELAKTMSTDPGGQNGGELGWVQPGVLPETMTVALGELEAGDFTSEPVQTDFGWHVLLLQEKRNSQSQVPDFEAVKPQIRNALVTQELQKKINELRAGAEIELAQ